MSGDRRAPARSRGAMSPRQLALMLAMMAALLWQSLVTQTHLHSDPPAASAAARHHEDGLSARHGHPASQPEDCPICHEIAQAGHYLTPSAIVLSFLLLAIGWVAPALLPHLTGRPRWRGWQSRAPPTLLQA